MSRLTRSFLFRVLHSSVATTHATPRRTAVLVRRHRRQQPSLDLLEGRVVPSTVSSITSNFNGTAIPAGDTIWFSSVAKVQGVGSSPVTLQVVDQTISFTTNGVNETVNVPNTQLILSPTATSAATSFNAGSNTWQTSRPVEAERKRLPRRRHVPSRRRAAGRDQERQVAGHVFERHARNHHQLAVGGGRLHPVQLR